MTTARRHLPLLIVVVAYLMLGAVYSIATPIFEASDEFWHFAYVKHLRDGLGLPTLDATFERHVVRQEVAQPPLYYAVAALATTWVTDVEDLRESPVNPHSRKGEPEYEASNRNMYIHSEAEDFPYRGTSLAVHIIRWLSVVLGAVVVVASYLIALQLRPGDQPLATLAAALTAFNPQFLFFSASVNNDNLINLLGGIGILLVLHFLNRSPSWRWAAALGIVVGLATVAKPGGLALLPLAGLAFVVLAWRERSLKRLFRDSGLLALPVVAIGGWWFIRNAQLYGDALALSCHRAFGHRLTPIGPLDIIPELGGLWRSYWGVFGGFNVLGPTAMYTLYDVLALLAGLGLLLGSVLGWRRGTYRSWFASVPAVATVGVKLGFTALWVALVFAALVRWTLMVPASQGRLLFPALAAASALLALGLWQFPAPKRLLGGATALALFGVAGLVPFTVISPAYAKPPLVSDQQLGAIPNPIRVSFDGKMELLGYALERTTVRPGGSLELTLYWRVLSKMEQDYSIYIHAYGAGSEPIGQVDAYPGGGAYRTVDLLPGQAFVERHRLHISPAAIGPTPAHIDVGLYDLATMRTLTALDGQMQSIHAAPAGSFRLLASPNQYHPEHQLSVRFGQQIELIGYDLPRREVAPGQALRGNLYWKALRAPDKDYTVFVHLVGPKGMVAQYDAQPRKGEYPTSKWEADEVLQDSFELSIPVDVVPGDYQAIVGLYELASGERLKTGRDNSAELVTITIR